MAGIRKLPAQLNEHTNLRSVNLSNRYNGVAITNCRFHVMVMHEHPTTDRYRLNFQSEKNSQEHGHPGKIDDIVQVSQQSRSRMFHGHP
jgi:hypothetical protein